MRVIFDIGHPAHVHFFRVCAKNLINRGHAVKFTTRNKESTIDLLKAYNLDYSVRGSIKSGMVNKAISMLSMDYEIYKVAKKFKPDIFVGIHNPYTAQVAWFMRKKSITFTDTEMVPVASRLTFPFTDTIITPDCFREKLNPKKHVKIKGYKELGYLHPKYFQPDPTVPEMAGLSKGDKYIIVRFISWDATHDIGLGGVKNPLNLIKTLERYGRVLVTSEKKLPPELEKYRITVSPEKIHSLLYYAQLYIGEGGTMATESALLGTPSIHIEANSQGVATGNFYGNFLDLRSYGLMYFYPDEKGALEKAVEILENPDSKKIWWERREKMLSEKIDVAAWMTDFIENYPESFRKYKEEEFKSNQMIL